MYLEKKSHTALASWYDKGELSTGLKVTHEQYCFNNNNFLFTQLRLYTGIYGVNDYGTCSCFYGHQVGDMTQRMYRFHHFFCQVVLIWLVLDQVTSFTPVAVLVKSGRWSNSRFASATNDETSIDNNIKIADEISQQQFRMDINNGYTVTGGYDPMLPGQSLWKTIFGNRSFGRVKSNDKVFDEDGWQEMRNVQAPLWRKLLRLPLKVSFRAIFPKPPVEAGTLILVRHGESLWNANKTFTGWADPDLSERGYREVEHAARLILEGGYEIDVVFTSRLKRAIRSVWIILQEMNQVYLPVFKSWRLNERMYGALTGLCKSETAQQLGAELVQEWRGSLKSRPPALKPSDTYWPGRDRKYADLSNDEIPLTESLSDCMERCLPIWEQKIMFELRGGKNVLVVAHANTLRGLVKVIDGVSDDDIRDIAIPTG
jgi:2,3-bisphosphoglycerate-dependent phosphoglycerate mutase